MGLLNKSMFMFLLLIGCMGEHLKDERGPGADPIKERPPVREILPEIREKPVENTLDDRQLRALFLRCETDLKGALKVVLEKDIIKNLTHFQSMDSGGRKYYLLEREAISEMIHSAIEGGYDDWVIINKSGRVIYTMRDNEIFNKMANSQLRGTPYDRSYEHHETPLYIDDTSSIASLGSGNYLVFSVKASSSGTSPGLLILVMNASHAVKALPEGAAAVGMDGLYKAVSDQTMINTPYPLFDQLPEPVPGREGALQYFKGPDGKEYVCRRFTYAEHTWILTAERYRRKAQ